MKNKILALILLCPSVGIAATKEAISLTHNTDYEIKPGKTFLCISKDMVGFNWINGSWVKQNFKNEKWLIRKISNEARECLLNNEKDKNYGHGWNLKRCFSIKEFGEGVELGSWLNTAPCHESYTSENSLKSIQCANHIFQKFAFQPNGQFMISSGDPGIPANKDTKADSYYVASGSCSSM